MEFGQSRAREQAVYSVHPVILSKQVLSFVSIYEQPVEKLWILLFRQEWSADEARRRSMSAMDL